MPQSERVGSPPLHIMHVIDTLGRGGAERMTVDLANITVERGHRASVCVTRTNDTLAPSLRPEVAFTLLGRTTRFDLPGMRRLAALVRAARVDVLHAHGRSSFALLAFLRTLGLVRAPILLHDHGPIERDRRVPLWLRIWARRLIAQYVGVHPRLGEWASGAGIPRDRIRVLGNAIDLRRLNAAPGIDLRSLLSIPEDALVGVAVAGWRPGKGLHVLIDALGRTAQRNALGIVIVGAGLDESYYTHARAMTRELGVEKQVVFLGERQDVPSIVRGADFAIMPSLHESGPLTLIEFLAAGLPVVYTNTGDIAMRSAQRGVPGFIAPEDARAMAQELDVLVGLSPDERQRRGDMGRAVATESFDLRCVFDAWLDVYAATLKESAPA